MPGSRRLHPGVVNAMAAAVLFGASVPLAKMLTGRIAPLLLAGLLYIGSGLGLLGLYAVRRFAFRNGAPGETGIARADIGWFVAAIAVGGVVSPALLMTGLRAAEASTASLLLNFEGAFTALVAWIVFKENFDRRIALGMLAILSAGLLLVWPSTGLPHEATLGSLAIVGACLGWAIDNNLTRKVSGGDPLLIAGIKGSVAGTVNTVMGLIGGGSLPGSGGLASAALVGFAGYGLSLVLYVLALRKIGAARTGAYFSVAPFIGAIISIPLLQERPGTFFWLAAGLMAIGIWLHVSERHEHLHFHDALIHSHSHVHDEHHQHEHDFPWNGTEPHAHLHEHAPLRHSHHHYPDIHHRHRH